MNLADISDSALRALLGNRCNTDGGLAEGTDAATFKTAATVDFTINGIHYTDASGTDNLTFTAGHTKLLDGYSQLFIIAIDSAGAYTSYQGMAFKSETDVDGTTKYRGYNTDTIGDADTVRHVKSGFLETYNSAFLPTNVPDTVCPVGVIKVATSGADFTPGTTDLGAGTVTDTYYDVSVVPANKTF